MWFVYLIVVGIFTAYISAHALQPGAPFSRSRPVRRNRVVPRLRGGAVAAVDLVQAVVEHHDQGDGRLAHLCLITALTFAYFWPK